MFQIIDLILRSPVGGLIVSAMKNTVYAATILADCDECGFNDLGKLLFGGLILAIVVGVAGSLIWRRAKEKNAATSGFVSIKSNEPPR